MPIDIGVSPITGKRRSIPDVGAFLRQIRRGVQAAVDPNFAADEYTRQWELQNQQKASAKEKADRNKGMESSDIPIWDPVAKKYVYDVTKQVPIVTGLDGAGNVDLRKSDTYKQYAQTPEGQFERYFKTPEFDYVFGAASRGKGAPTDLAGMEALAGQTTAPTSAPLSSYYRARSAAGRANMDEIVSALGYKGTPMEQWAKANPMLAFDQFNKKFPAGELTQGPTPAIPGVPIGEEGTAGQRALEGARYQLSGDSDNFATPANPIPPTEQPGFGGMTQGERVDYFRGADNLKLQQAAFTSGGNMPTFLTTGDKAAEFLKRPSISTLF